MTRQADPETPDVSMPQPSPVGRLRRLFRFGVLGVVLSCFTAFVFAASLAVTMPASTLRRVIDLPEQIIDLRGTIWNGSATLTDGYVLQWKGHLAALILAKISADVTLTGADTQLDGRLNFGPRAIALHNLTGRAGPGLLQLVPALPIDRCASRAIVDVAGISFGRGVASAEGQIDIESGACLDFAGNAIAVPALTLTLQSKGNDAVADLSDATSALAQVTVTGDRRLIIRVEPAGAKLIPGMPSSGPIILEYPF